MRVGARFRNAAAQAIGRLAQLVERLLYTERVGGSSPSPPTNNNNELRSILRSGGPRFPRYSPKTHFFRHRGMADSSPTVAELFKAKAVTDDDVTRLVQAVLDGVADRAPLADG